MKEYTKIRDWAYFVEAFINARLMDRYLRVLLGRIVAWGHFPDSEIYETRFSLHTSTGEGLIDTIVRLFD